MNKTEHIKKKGAKIPPVKGPGKGIPAVAPPKETAAQVRTSAAKVRMIAAMEKSLGVVTEALRKAKVGRTQYYAWIKEDPEFKASIETVSDIALDFSESALFKQIRNGNYVSTIFHLKTKGKSRGYVEKTETDVKVTAGSTVIDWMGTHVNNNTPDVKAT